MDTKQENKDSKIDQDLFSRQLYIFDINSMTSIQSTYLIAIGLENSALEILKNIVLAGLTNIELYDPRLINESDLSYGFYITEKDLNKRRDLVFKRILEENILQSINVKVHENKNTFNFESFKEILKYQHICLVNEGIIQNFEDLNNLCREKQIRFLGVKTRGFFSFVFSDLIEFISSDTTGESNLSGYGILNGNILDLTDRKDFTENMKIKIIDELSKKEFITKVEKVNNLKQIVIGNAFEEFNDKVMAVSFEEIKVPTKFSHENLTNSLKKENKILCEPWEIEEKNHILQMFRTECMFFHKMNRMPGFSDLEKFKEIYQKEFSSNQNLTE